MTRLSKTLCWAASFAGGPTQSFRAILIKENPMVDKVVLSEKFNRFSEAYQPKIAAQLNDSYLKVVKIRGEFVWHQHANEDELFWVIQGRMQIKLRDGDVWLGPGELDVIPRGVEHC